MGTSRAVAELNQRSNDIDKYIYLRDLQRDDEELFYRLLLSHTEEILPFVYTPTVGEACENYHNLPIKPRGLYLRATDSGNFLKRLQEWPQQDIRVIVVTDGERILGLGDLGAGGMGIAEGKILLYTAAAGVHPGVCLPVCLDLGTNNQRLLADPNYKGLRQKRLSGAAFDAAVQEFMSALQQWQPHVMVQFEDFGNHNAFRILQMYSHRMCCFNDDIQGTACITLAGILSALRATGKPLSQQLILFHGAGEAGTGIGELVAAALQQRHGLSREEARKHCVFMDSKGLVCAGRRAELQPHKLPFAHDLPFQPDLLSAIRHLRPTALIGVSTIPASFTPQVLAAMAELNERPIIFPLSNPTSKAECTFRQAWEATAGRVLFASGSPFPPLLERGRRLYPSQANNAYVFPAIGFAATLTRAKTISEDTFLIAAEVLAYMTSLQELEQGLLFPRFSHIYGVSASVAAQVAEHMVAVGDGRVPDDFHQFTAELQKVGRPAGVSAWEAYVRRNMFAPTNRPRL